MKETRLRRVVFASGLLSACAFGGCLTIEPSVMVQKEQQARYYRVQAEVTERNAADQRALAKGLREEASALLAKRDECLRASASYRNMGTQDSLILARYHAEQAARFEAQAKAVEQNAGRIEREVAYADRAAIKLRKQASDLDREAQEMARKLERLGRDDSELPASSRTLK